MKIARLLKLADFVENAPERQTAIIPDTEAEEYTVCGFDMNNYFHPCGAPSCLAGYTLAMKYELSAMDDVVEHEATNSRSSRYNAADYLGLTEDQSTDLFTPATYATDEMLVRRWEIDPYKVTQQQAAAVVRHLAKTGIVDWNILAETDVRYETDM